MFKIVTLTGALEARTVRRNESFPVQTAATLEGVELQNAHGESCGGSLISSVRALVQLGVRADGRRAGGREAGRDGRALRLQRGPGLAGAARSTIPAANEIGDDLAVGSTAIGQGKVLTTPLQMALIAAAIGEDGRRMRPTLRRGEQTRAVQAAERRRFVDRAMRAVVDAARASAPRSPAWWSRARPAPRSCGRRSARTRAGRAGRDAAGGRPDGH